MWINEMLTIWLYGSLFALALIAFSLLRWYRPQTGDQAGDERVTDEGLTGQRGRE